MRKPRVMIFDDDRTVLELLHIFFSQSGYEVFPYNTPILCPLNENSADRGACLAQCADLVLSDFKMPKMTGIELLRLQSGRGCRIGNKMKAIMSGYSGEEIAVQSERPGYKLFKKPFDFTELSGWLRECEKDIDLSQQLCGNKIKRRHDFRQDIEYQLNTAGPDRKFIGFTVNKSPDGLGLRVFNPLYAGQKIKIINGLEVPDLKGIVVWCSKVGENTYSAGLRLCS
jgi:FixJ family two-component response regulator